MKQINFILLSVVLLLLASCSTKQSVEGVNYKSKGKDKGELNTGLNIGIVGFNNFIYSSPIYNLNPNSNRYLTNFVYDLKLNNGTLLYNAVDEALNNIEDASVPSNLNNLIIITFTDGLDQGSLMFTDKYRDESQYSDALYSRIISTQKNGAQLQALSIGLKGADVTNYERFSTNLRNLSSEEKNVTEVNSMREVKAKLGEIADSLIKVSFDFKQNLKITMPGVGDGTRVRFVLDGSLNPDESNLYIEGTFCLAERSLKDLLYKGLTCEIPYELQASLVDGAFVTFNFEGLRTYYGAIDKANIKEFTKSGDFWQINSEFVPSNNSETTANVTQNNALVMLVIDCSSSLQDDFDGLKMAVTDFVAKLSQWNDPLVVEQIMRGQSDLFNSGRVNTPVQQAAQKSKQTIKVGDVSFEMVYVEGGSFSMDADSKGQKELTINGFYMGTTEVTNELWQAVMKGNSNVFAPNVPVSNVSWDDCQKFIKKLNSKTGLNFRIPTEVEWEYAARGGINHNDFIYAGSNDFLSVAWTSENSNATIQEVGLKAPNALGLFDMSGNLYEWCEYDPLSEEFTLNSQSDLTTKIIRGGCFNLPGRKAGISSRDLFQKKERNIAIGLRLVL